MTHFIGRKQELETLKSFLKKKSASFIVIRGRRRIGKSRLINQFGQFLPSCLFSGLPPVEKTTMQSQINEFSRQMALNFNMPKLTFSDWGEVFWQLGQLTSQGQMMIALDEISWIGSKDPDFLGKLKNAWDLYFSKNPKLILIVCGSVSSWIQKNILSSTGFLGRISLDMVLEELPLHRCIEFWDHRKSRISPYEVFKLLSVTGGVPRYIEEIIPELPAEENIRRLCFQKGGLLVREFDQIFSDLFSKQAALYSKIVAHLAKGSSNFDEICLALSVKKSGKVSEYLDNLIQSGFISEHPTWDIRQRKISNLKKYRLSDNYLRFYFRCILPNKEQISRGLFQESLHRLPGWEAILGLQFENLVIHNARKVFQCLKISSADVVMFGPFFQRTTKKRKGCQIDLLIQSKYHVLYLCEIKFLSGKVGMEAVGQIKTKLDHLDCPRNFSVQTVLVHVNGVTQGVLESREIDHIIDFSQLYSSSI